MAYIVSATLWHAFQNGAIGGKTWIQNFWIKNMLLPDDYSPKSIHDSTIRDLMKKIEF